jgi:diguanylate cyclase (GGDEF)-like protein
MMAFAKLVFKESRILFWLTLLLTIILPIISILVTLMITNPLSLAFVSGILTPLYNLLTTAILFFTAFHLRKTSKQLFFGWGILAMAHLSASLGDILWSVFELGLKISPSPSFADFFYLCYYPLFFFGIILFSSQKITADERTKRFLDIVIILVASTLVYWVYLINPLLVHAVASPILQTVISVAYPIGDLVLLLALLLMIYYHSERIHFASIFFLGSALVVTIVTDTIYSIQEILESYQSGGLLDVGWILSYIIFALAAVTQAVDRPAINPYAADPKPQSSRKTYLYRVFSYLPYLWVVGAYILLTLKHDQANERNSVILAIGVGVIFALVIFRQITDSNENLNLLSAVRESLEHANRQAAELDRSNHNLRQEIIERNRVEEKLSHDALHDRLTGLANRVLFMDHLAHAVEVSKRQPAYQHALLFIDLDNFKAINDVMGHSVGDLALIEVGNRLARCARSIDTIARMSGDEFVILIENSNGDKHGMTVANRIFCEMEQPFSIRDDTLSISCSIGIVQNISGYNNAEEILRDADIAMNSAKDKGKKRHEVFNVSLRMQTLTRLEIERDLHLAIQNNDFILNFQPIFALEKNRIVAFEVLVRWRHPQRGLIMPGEFIDIAEKSGLIIPLGDWILQESCAQLKRWLSEFPQFNDLSVCVNISAVQIREKDFVKKVLAALSKTGLAPRHLRLEITENSLIENQVAANELFAELRKRGIQIMIDDFGTGYSSLGYLKNIAVNTIKIDKSFVQDLLDGEKSLEIFKTIVQMAHGLGLDTLAEGIETLEQLEKITDLQCRFGQGFYLSRPMSAGQASRFLETQHVFLD